MASITQNKKDGKVISYKFKACIGRDEFGKQIFRCTTWKVPDGLAVARVEKSAQKAAAEWEQQAKEEYKRDVENPERIKVREIEKREQSFPLLFVKYGFPSVSVTASISLQPSISTATYPMSLQIISAARQCNPSAEQISKSI